MKLCLGCFIRKESATRRGKRGTLCDECFAEPEPGPPKKEFIQVPIYHPTDDKENHMAKKSKSKKTKATPIGATPKVGKKLAAKANGHADPLGRPGTLSRFMADQIMAGKDNDTISAAAKKAFPKQKSTEAAHVSWTRFNLKRRGVKVPAAKEA